MQHHIWCKNTSDISKKHSFLDPLYIAVNTVRHSHGTFAEHSLRQGYGGEPYPGYPVCASCHCIQCENGDRV